ncbi:lysophospholipid acyltransferase family protein [Swaminathania salitolerans]|uniref:1-acyl-sn-glycerol-3-phosphate acyltransferase n=1 Tax=Swaminathania salitolerans TaxID=182838 RepID=A0A511BNL0_9PROT|nr:lysophospholipid acyltransferase family protein [Swaminathania salitolerans]GBQ16259.1 1-acyl-sn-glycerol-3-phosphate acyltransferase [Swaminathania salitolerans LMG 21291]GEL01652.1 1-acyl-sn-glycerol-3-phosphate acyltransferase [Swaminathania salitolerans]
MTDAITRRRPVSDASGTDPWTTPLEPALGSQTVRTLRAVRRIFLSCLWTLLASIPQRILLRRRGAAKIVFARFYWATICRILGLKVTLIGEPAGTIRDGQAVKNGERPIIFVANHSSWLDIAVTGGVLPTVFVAKQQIADWPIIGTLARLGRTIFVSRQRNNTGRELQAMTDRLTNGDNLILFPEGTSTDGTHVLPFMSSFFAVAKPSRVDPTLPTPPSVLIQPVSIVYDRLDGLPVGRARRTALAWYGDMELAPHIWSVTQWRSLGATVILHPPVDPADFPGRKELSGAVQKIVADGVARLHVQPLGASPPVTAPQPVL